MTTGDRCIPVELLEEASQRPSDDPGRRHLETCPRCRARLAELEDFLRRTPAPPEARPGEARLELQQWLDTQLLAPAPVRARPLPVARRRWQPWAASPGWRLAAVAAAVVVAAGTWAVLRPQAPVPGAAVRGEGGAPRGGMSREIFALSLEPESGAGVRVRWAPVVGADRYEVTVHAPDLSVLARFDAGDRTVATVPDSLLGGLPGRPATLLRVHALRLGDELARSGFVRLPRRASP